MNSSEDDHPSKEVPTHDGDIVNDSVSTRAPKIRMRTLRYLFRDSTVFLIFKIFLVFALAGLLSIAFWSMIFGYILLGLATAIGFSIWRYLGQRRIEFQNAVLCPGMVVCENPVAVLILANLNCGGSAKPTWGVKLEEVRSVSPYSNTAGTRVPCVSAFQGGGFGGAWDRMVSSPLTSGTGDRALLDEALARLDDESEWEVLRAAVAKEQFPRLGETGKL